MATQVWPELTNIQDEDVLRKMWQETEDFGRKKEIRARMYKIREQRLKDFYTTGDAQSEVSVRKTKTHTESIGDQGSFLTMKTKEIRDSESPTRDISCVRRGEKEIWKRNNDANRMASESEIVSSVETQQISIPTESVEVTESSSINTNRVSSQSVAQTRSVETSKISSQSVSQSSISEAHRSGHSLKTSGQSAVVQSGARYIASDKGQSLTSSKLQSTTSGNQRVSSQSSVQHGGEQSVTTSRTVKQSRSGGPGEVITTTVTSYTTSDSNEPVEHTSVSEVRNSNQTIGGGKESQQIKSAVVESKTIVRSEPKISQSVSESVSRSQQSHQTKSSSYSTQSVSSVQKTSSAVEQGTNIVSNKIIDTTSDVSSCNRDNTVLQSSKTSNEHQSLSTQNLASINKTTTVHSDHEKTHKYSDQITSKNDQIQITEVDSHDQIHSKNVTASDNRKQGSIKSIDAAKSQREEHTRDIATSGARSQKEEARIKSSTNSTDQKILNEIQKLDTFLSTQPTPSNSDPISQQNNVDINWPVDREFIYTDNSRDSKTMVNGGRCTPVRHPSNLELPKGASDGQYVTTYQHDYSPRVSRDHDTNHQYFASTLRASPDRSSPSPSKRSSSKGSLDRSTPDRKFRGSPSRKTPDRERRLSSSSYTIERIPDTKRFATDGTEKSQTLPKDSKPKRKLSSTQTKVANKTRVSTPGVSPTSSPTRVQKARKQSSSDSDSDHSNATFNKTSSLKKLDSEGSKKYGSTKVIRGSSLSVNNTDNESRILSSPSPTRYPARENTPDYSSEGSITRELRTARNIEKTSTTFDSSPERSAFAPIKSYRASPEKKDLSLNMIDEERKHMLGTTLTSDTNFADHYDINLKSNLKDIKETRQSIMENIIDDTDRVSKDKCKNSVSAGSSKDTRSKQKTVTPSSSPDRKVKKNVPQPKTIEKGRKPETKPRTPVSSPERNSPVKSDRNINTDRKSPTKRQQYNSTIPSSEAPKTKVSNTTVVEKNSSTKKITKTTDGDRITRRSSIPRAEIKYTSRPIKEPESKSKPSFTRDTASSATRISTIRATSPAIIAAKTSTSKSVDRVAFVQTKDIKTTSLKKPDYVAQKRPTQYSKPIVSSKLSPQDSKMKPKTLLESKKETSRTKTPESLGNVKKEGAIKTTKVIKKDNEIKISAQKTKKEISQINSMDMIKNKKKEIYNDDKESSIEDEQPPEFFDEFEDRDETDQILIEDRKADSTNFKKQETDVSVTHFCETRTSDRKISEAKINQKIRENSNTFIAAEQSTVKPKTPSKDLPKTSKKKTSIKKDDKDESSSSEEDDVIIQYEDYSEVEDNKSNQMKITKRDVSKKSTTDKSKMNSLKVTIQQPKSSRESSPEKIIPMSVTSDGGQTPRYADFVTEPEDVEIFDSSNLGPNRPIQSTLIDENRIHEESEDSARENSKVSVAERVSKYIEKTNKVDIVTLDTTRQKNEDSSSDVFKTKELFESVTQQQPEYSTLLERRGSKKYSDTNEFVQRESVESVKQSEITNTKSVNVVDKSKSIVSEKDAPKIQKAQKQSPKKQSSNEDILKISERRLSEHSPDIELKKAFFENKLKESQITDISKTPLEQEDEQSVTSTSEEKIPHYMKDTATAVTRKESIQREFAPVRQGTETDMYSHNKEKRGSIDIDRLDSFVKSESHDVSKDLKMSTVHSGIKDITNRRRSSVEIQQLDTFKKSEAFILCDDRSKVSSEKRKSIDSQKTITNVIGKKESTDIAQAKKKSTSSKSPERSPSHKPSKDKSSDRIPLKRKDTNIMNEENVNVTTKTGKFGVTLRRTSSTGASSTPKPSFQEILQSDTLPEIEEIFDLQFLEILLTRAVLYDERRRIRAQIRVVKKESEPQQNQQSNRRPQTTPKVEKRVKEDTLQKKETSKERTTINKQGTRTASPIKDANVIGDSKKPSYMTSTDRVTKSSIDRKDSQKVIEKRRVSQDKNTTTVHSVRSYTSPDKKYSVKETRSETHRVSSATSPDRKTTADVISRKSTPYPLMVERKGSTIESRSESHSTYRKSSTDKILVREGETRKIDITSRTTPDRKETITDGRKRSKPSPDRKYNPQEFRKASEIGSASSRLSPDRKLSKDFDVKSSYSIKDEERRLSDVRRSSKSSPERKATASYETRKISETRKYSTSSPERRVSSEVTESSRRESSSHVVRTSTHSTTATSSVGRKGEDSITSSYGVGPTDDQGRPLFGLRALRSSNRTPDEPSDIEVGEDVGDRLVEDVRGSDGRPIFGLKALKSVTTTTTSTTVTSDMPSTQHLVQKHQQFLSEVKSSEEKVRNEAPRARLRDSFILDSDDSGANVVSSIPQPHGVSLKSIIQKHEDMASTGKHVRKEVQSTKTVMSSHGTVSSDGKVSVTKHMVHGELRGKDGAEPTGKITTSQYSYKSSDDPSQRPQVSSTMTTTQIGGTHRNSITSLGEVRIEEVKDSECRKDSLVSSARKSLESRQKEESKQTDQSSWQTERKTIVRGDSIKALQHKFQQPTVSSALKRVSGEEARRTSVEERRSSVKDDREDSSRITSRSSTTTITSSSTTRRDSSASLASKQTNKDGSKSVTSFLDDTSKVTGVQDILQRMRNADFVTEGTDTTEDCEARSLLNKFLGASVILQGMEAGGAGPASSALVSQVERQRILTSTQRKTDDIDDISDEKQLQILLEACSDYEQRRKIRARLRKIMSDKKGGQGELLGGEEGEERREEFSESRQISSSDGGTFTKTEVHNTSSSTARLTKANSVQQSPFAKFRQLERQNSAPSGGALFKMTDPKLVRSASTIKDRLLCWARAQTSGYKNVQIDNFSTSWSNGLAFCALIHHFYPDAFDYDSLTPESRRHNFELAFRIAEEQGDIYPLLDVEDMVAMRKPDWKCVFTYVQSIYRRMHNQPNAIKSF